MIFAGAMAFVTWTDVLAYEVWNRNQQNTVVVCDPGRQQDDMEGDVCMGNHTSYVHIYTSFKKGEIDMLILQQNDLDYMMNIIYVVHSSCEIEEDFVETHLCKLCVILRSRILLGVCRI